MIVRYETLKANIRAHRESTAQKYRFFRPFQTDKPISEHLKEMRDTFESRIRKIKR